MFDYNNNSASANTINCRNNGDINYRTTGAGEYTNKPPVIDVICVGDEMMLRSVKTSFGTTYEIFCDGELFCRSKDKREAETMFMDFLGISKAKFVKLCAKTEADKIAKETAKKEVEARAKASKKEKEKQTVKRLDSATLLFTAAWNAA